LGKKARKGIFITTSTFSRVAHLYVEALDSKIVLINSRRLAELMIDHNVGGNPVANYEVKKIDTDYLTDS